MIVASAAVIARPLMTNASPTLDGAVDQAEELLEREKNAALLAIREADFDRAMGKLSDEDYNSLRKIYEQRALGAMNALEHTAESDRAKTDARSGSSRALYCVRCGSSFEKADKFCTGCGAGRPRLVRPE